MENMHKLKLKL